MATDRKIQDMVHGKVAVALRHGVLKKEPCSKCGNPNAHAHHEDYNKPLEVVWLCKPCHVRRHAQIRKETGMVLKPTNHYVFGREREYVLPETIR